MSRTRRFEETILDYVDHKISNELRGFASNNRLWLAGGEGPGGGSGLPPGTIIGQLVQTRVAYDTSEAASMCIVGSSSLLHNLNAIRYRMLPTTWFETSPTAVRSMQVEVASGLWYPEENSPITFAGGTSPVISAPVGNPRIDVIYITEAGAIGVQEGTEAANPTITMPAVADVLPAAAIYVTPTASGIGWSCEDYEGYIYKDLRPFVTYPGGNTPDPTARGEILRSDNTPDWETHDAKTDHFILVGDGVDITSKAFDWDDLSAGVAADMVHDHSTAGEGGQLDWDVVWSDAVHDHSNAAEGGEVPLTSIGNYSRGHIPVGGAADWEALDANDDGKILVGDATDLNSVAVSGDVELTNTGNTKVVGLQSRGVANNLPADAQALIWSDANARWEPQNQSGAGVGVMAGGSPVLQIDGTLVILTEVGGAFICPEAGVISYVWIYCSIPGSANNTIIDVNKNGVTIFTNQANRPSLAHDDGDQIAKSGAPDITATAEGDLLTVDIDGIATGAALLTVVIGMSPTTAPSHPHSGGPHTGSLALSELEDDDANTGYPLLSGGGGGNPAYAQIAPAGIAADAIETSKIKDLNVTTAKLANDAVETVKIKNLNVTAAKLAADSVETAKIKDLNVTVGKLANNAVETIKIKDLNVTTGKLANSAVETVKIADLNVTTGKLAANAVETAKIKDLNVTAAKLAANSVETSKIKDLNVTTAKLANNAVTDAKVGTRVPFFWQRQGGNATNWSTPGTNSYTPTDSVQMEGGSIAGPSPIDVTFPSPFGDVPMVIVAGAVIVTNISSAGCRLTTQVGSSINSSWLAIGPPFR